MKIGEEVYVHGFVDEIRNDVIIIRNNGGYFGTDPSEVEPTYCAKDYECVEDFLNIAMEKTKEAVRKRYENERREV